MPLEIDLGPLVTSRGNARVKSLRAALSGRPACPGDLLGLEGRHLVYEAHRSGLSFETVFLREGSESLLDRTLLQNLRTQHWARLSHGVFDAAVSTGSPQGIAATWTLCEPRVPSLLQGIVLVLEDLQDPGNVGTLLRSAEAFGADLLMATPATASQWSPKVMRASAGSVFRLPVLRAALGDLVATLRAHHIRIVAAARGATAALLPDADLTPPCALLIGNEGAGLSHGALALADARVQIPCAAESLNAGVAGSILLYEALRQRQPHHAHTPRSARP